MARTGIDIHHLEGAFGRVPEGATAFPNRSARYWLNVYGFWHDPGGQCSCPPVTRGDRRRGRTPGAKRLTG
jgi:hypothetical protein